MQETSVHDYDGAILMDPLIEDIKRPTRSTSEPSSYMHMKRSTASLIVAIAVTLITVLWVGSGFLVYAITKGEDCTAQCRTPALENGNILGNMNSIGSRVKLICNHGYKEVTGENEATCLSNGSWSHEPQCKRDCKEPPKLANSTVSNGDTYEENSRTYTCNSGLLFSTGTPVMTTTCQFNGQWSAAVCPTADGCDNLCKGCAPLRDCQDVQSLGHNQTGVYTIYPTGNESFNVRCDMDTLPGGWTVIQRRITASDFYKSWDEYKAGFGDLNENFWLGNEEIWALTRHGSYKLRVDLTDQIGVNGYAEYNSFSIGDESSAYTLNIAGYSGNVGDSLIRRHNGMMFSTKDRDNDIVSNHCAVLFTGAWWYSDCHYSNLNGLYSSTDYGKGINWESWRGHTASMTSTEMKIIRQ